MLYQAWFIEGKLCILFYCYCLVLVLVVVCMLLCVQFLTSLTIPRRSASVAKMSPILAASLELM